MVKFGHTCGRTLPVVDVSVFGSNWNISAAAGRDGSGFHDGLVSSGFYASVYSVQMDPGDLVSLHL